jgi:hypothetical protein
LPRRKACNDQYPHSASSYLGCKTKGR